jgi:hypothetical protein
MPDHNQNRCHPCSDHTRACHHVGPGHSQRRKASQYEYMMLASENQGSRARSAHPTSTLIASPNHVPDTYQIWRAHRHIDVQLPAAVQPGASVSHHSNHHSKESRRATEFRRPIGMNVPPYPSTHNLRQRCFTTRVSEHDVSAISADLCKVLTIQSEDSPIQHSRTLQMK